MSEGMDTARGCEIILSDRILYPFTMAQFRVIRDMYFGNDEDVLTTRRNGKHRLVSVTLSLFVTRIIESQMRLQHDRSKCG